MPADSTPSGAAAGPRATPSGHPVGRAPAPATPRRLALALQGGGSHGAFTWGVLDTLLSDERLAVEALSGTSAGAVNAVALAAGWADGQATGPSAARAGARERLAQVWTEIGEWGTLGAWQALWSRLLWGGLPGAQWAHTNLWAQVVNGWLSPYQTNPFDLNPLRDLLRRRIDFRALRHPGVPRVFVSATHVATGKAAIFGGSALGVEAVTASACLPTLFQAVEIDGKAYWDGGYSVNPALSPLIASCGDPDLVVVQINPLRRDSRADTADEILDRMNELTFNASLLAQMRGIDRINRLLADGHLTGSACKPVRLHRIDGGTPLLAFTAASKTDPDPGLIRELFRIGQEAARAWLARHFEALGQRSTVDVRRDYEDDTRIAWPEVCPMPTPAPAGGTGGSGRSTAPG